VTATRRVVVLGTNHRLQGSPLYPNNVNDPGYHEKLRGIISDESIDFIFEEASQCGPTTAEQLVDSLRRMRIRYLDIDPHPDSAHKQGVLTATGQPFPRNISPEDMVEKDAKREELWCKQIAAKDFNSGLVICGCLHTLSVSFRLRSAGFIVKFIAYIPHDKLCSHGDANRSSSRNP
jgi:hypothetical protein